ncbi:MAG TPA: polysaccharide deacetylase family protein [Ferruginibacter sp.]|nr:polysaccharide deacetylase family protein [Ferruginibacter sp.]HRP50479.1 polysaccharide deacetylase family protein [Ferruginibacter sp.]
MSTHPGTFCISLDFELHWGCFERMTLNEAEQTYFMITRELIPVKLDLFRAYDTHVTWAVVGMLYHRNVEEWNRSLPAHIPTFKNPKVSAYEWIKQYGFLNETDPCHFAPDLIQKIKTTPHQEIATHTYAHYFCLEEGQTREQFREDLEMAVRIAREDGSEIHSLVFPRNQFNPEYLSVCKDVGISAVRSSPNIWYWKYATGSTFKEKFFRAGDAYIKMQPIKPVKLEDIDIHTGMPLLLPSTRLYRAWQPKFKVQNFFKLRRILNEMTEAARKGYYYHLWWHPHNFGYHPHQCLEELEQILQHYQKLSKLYGFKSMTMHEITQYLRNE